MMSPKEKEAKAGHGSHDRNRGEKDRFFATSNTVAHNRSIEESEGRARVILMGLPGFNAPVDWAGGVGKKRHHEWSNGEFRGNGKIHEVGKIIIKVEGY